jgi:fumarate hydratase class II
MVTALNSLIGYGQGAELVKEAVARSLTIHDIAVEKARGSTLKHIDGDRLVTIEEIEAALNNLRRLS